MSKYITSDDIHELKMHPSFLSLADEDHGSVQNIVKNYSPIPSRFAPSTHWAAKVKQSHQKYPDLDFHKTHNNHSRKSLSIKSDTNSVAARNDLKPAKKDLLAVPVEEESEFSEDSEYFSEKENSRSKVEKEGSKTKLREVVDTKVEKLPDIFPASTKTNKKADNATNNANNCVCPKQCKALWSNYKYAVEKKLCLCEFHKQLQAHTKSCPYHQTSRATNSNNFNQNANIEDTLDVNMMQHLDQFKEKWETLEKTGKLPEIAEEGTDRPVEKKPIHSVKLDKSGEKEAEKKGSDHADIDEIDSNKLLFNMCKRLNEYKNRMVNDDIEREVKCEWQQVAMVIDRLMFFIFTTAIITVIIYMYSVIPPQMDYHGLEVDENGHPFYINHHGHTH